MKRLAAGALAIALVSALGAPASAELRYTLPVGYRSLALTAGSDAVEARGAFVPLIWFGGPTRFFKLRFEAGGAYLKDGRGETYTYGVGQASANFELPLGPLTPYAGIVGHYAVPFQQPSYVTGNPYGYMPQAGIALDLGLAEVDLHVAQGPVYGLSRNPGAPYAGTLTEIGGRLALTF
ncbi:MAG TPA: hypothetical protein V6D00_15650 [Pantanalinema sp.]